MAEIWIMPFLKWHDMSGFLDNLFLYSDGMSVFCGILLPKWRSLSEISNITLPVCIIQPEI